MSSSDVRTIELPCNQSGSESAGGVPGDREQWCQRQLFSGWVAKTKAGWKQDGAESGRQSNQQAAPQPA
jgi:hypothetical protein